MHTEVINLNLCVCGGGGGGGGRKGLMCLYGFHRRQRRRSFLSALYLLKR